MRNRFVSLFVCSVALHLAAARAEIFSPDELVVEALVDGGSSFHLRSEGFYWVNGSASKPGRWGGRNEPTYINGAAWTPRWAKNSQNSGPDKTEINRIAFGTVDVDYELLAVTKERGGTGIDKRTSVGTKREGSEFVVTIPDPEAEARWYKFVLRKRKK